MFSLKQRFELLQKEKPGITQADLARATGAKPPSVNAWFTGETKSMKAETAAIAASLYGVSALWLATGKGPKEPQGIINRAMDDLSLQDSPATGFEQALLTLVTVAQTTDDLTRDQIKPLINRMFDEPARAAEIAARISAAVSSGSAGTPPITTTKVGNEEMPSFLKR